MDDAQRRDLYEQALRRCAAAAINARGRTTGTMQRLPPEAGAVLLCEVEAALSGLVTLGATPLASPALQAYADEYWGDT